MVGMHGTYEANLAMHGCDLMVAVGFAVRRSGDRTPQCPSHPVSKKIHIDIDPSSINKNVRVDLPIIGDVGEAMSAILGAGPTALRSSDGAARAEWWRPSKAGARATACTTTKAGAPESNRNMR